VGYLSGDYGTIWPYLRLDSLSVFQLFRGIDVSPETRCLNKIFVGGVHCPRFWDTPFTNRGRSDVNALARDNVDLASKSHQIVDAI
jgi:hypothetical protein